MSDRTAQYIDIIRDAIFEIHKRDEIPRAIRMDRDVMFDLRYQIYRDHIGNPMYLGVPIEIVNWRAGEKRQTVLEVGA